MNPIKAEVNVHVIQGKVRDKTWSIQKGTTEDGIKVEEEQTVQSFNLTKNDPFKRATFISMMAIKVDTHLAEAGDNGHTKAV